MLIIGLIFFRLQGVNLAGAYLRTISLAILAASERALLSLIGLVRSLRGCRLQDIPVARLLIQDRVLGESEVFKIDLTRHLSFLRRDFVAINFGELRKYFN